MSFHVDTPSTQDVLSAVLRDPLPPLPPQEQHLGSALVAWWETDPGQVYIHAEGGTADDRHYGSTLVALALAPHGFRRAQFDLDRGTNKYEGDEDPAWNWQKDRQAQEYGMHFRSYGDAVPGGYNGGYSAHHPETGAYMGNIDYNSADRDAVIADLKVHPDYQRQGVATKLFDYAQRYDPEMTWSHGMTTPEGEAWKQSLGHREGSEDPSRVAMPRHASPSLGPPGLAPPCHELHESSIHEGGWPDIQTKAKRLMAAGQVQLLRNGFNYIVGHVVGDHGDYQCEISRDDPGSRAITGWQCQCDWDQYAWQRTRKWKKFEGRPCSHILALYWTSLATPMDEDLSPDQAEAMGTGQKLPAKPVADHPPEIEKRLEKGEDVGKLPRSFGPEGDVLQGDQLKLKMPPDATGGPPGPAQAPLAPPPKGGPQGPAPPGILPPFQAPPEAPPYAGPGTTPGGGESPPGAVTVPGAKPTTPMNPLQLPGTYSATQFTAPQVVRLKKPALGQAQGPVPGQYGDGEYREIPAGTKGEVMYQDPSTQWVECIFALDDSGPHEPFHVTCFLEPGDIEPTDQTNAFIRRQT